MKRGVAGSLVFIMFDTHVLLAEFRRLAQESDKYKFVSDNDESRPQVFTQARDRSPLGDQRLLTQGIATNARRNNFEQAFAEEGAEFGALDSGWTRTTPWYSDQIPPFNITLTGVNEQGYASTMAILGVDILNEGYGISIDDIVSEQQMTFVAREVSPWTRVTGADFQAGHWKAP